MTTIASSIPSFIEYEKALPKDITEVKKLLYRAPTLSDKTKALFAKYIENLPRESGIDKKRSIEQVNSLPNISMLVDAITEAKETKTVFRNLYCIFFAALSALELLRESTLLSFAAAGCCILGASIDLDGPERSAITKSSYDALMQLQTFFSNKELMEQLNESIVSDMSRSGQKVGIQTALEELNAGKTFYTNSEKK